MFGVMPFQMYGFSYSMPFVQYFGQMHASPYHYGHGGNCYGLINNNPVNRCGNTSQCAQRSRGSRGGFFSRR